MGALHERRPRRGTISAVYNAVRTAAHAGLYRPIHDIEINTLISETGQCTGGGLNNALAASTVTLTNVLTRNASIAARPASSAAPPAAPGPPLQAGFLRPSSKRHIATFWAALSSKQVE